MVVETNLSQEDFIEVLDNLLDKLGKYLEAKKRITDDNVDYLVGYLVKLMIAEDKYDIYYSGNSDEFVESILRGNGFVGYDNMSNTAIINEFINRTLCENSIELIESIERFVEHSLLEIDFIDTARLDLTNSYKVELICNHLVSLITCIFTDEDD